MPAMATDPARSRWLVLVLVRLAAATVAVLGVLLLANGVETGRKVLGGAIVIVALWTMAIVPRALARRWRSPVE
jgi:small-conductance mechanosensitive channel